MELVVLKTTNFLEMKSNQIKWPAKSIFIKYKVFNQELYI